MSAGWYYKLGGQEFGPVDDEVIRDLLTRSEIGLRTPVRQERADWSPVGELPQFIEAGTTAESSINKAPIKDEEPASMWRRGTAFAVDVLALLVAMFLLGNILSLVVVARRLKSDSLDISADLLFIRRALLAIPWLYFTVFEGSSLQATPGKLLMKIIVTDSSGCAPGFGRAALRSLAKYVSWSVFLLGFIIAPFTKRKQAFHDFIARTVVLNG